MSAIYFGSGFGLPPFVSSSSFTSHTSCVVFILCFRSWVLVYPASCLPLLFLPLLRLNWISLICLPYTYSLLCSCLWTRCTHSRLLNTLTHFPHMLVLCSHLFRPLLSLSIVHSCILHILRKDVQIADERHSMQFEPHKLSSHSIHL